MTAIDQHSAQAAPRTVVLFMVDQLAAKWLEKAREGIVDLPNFDRLQAAGVTFPNAFTANPVCAPSRASIATGLSSSAHGVSECGYDLDPAVPTVMHALQRAGWQTGAFGKLHFIAQIETLTPDYRPYGFDVVYNTEDSRAGEWLDWVRHKHPEHYEAAQSTVWMTMVPDLHAYGPDRIDLRTEILSAQQKYPQTREQAYELPFPAEVSQTAWITDRACDYLERCQGDAFTQISYVQPHNPFSPPKEYVAAVNAAAIPVPTAAAWRENPIPYYRQPRYAEPSYAGSDWRRERELYFADLAHLDHELGRILAVLENTARLEGTLFVFTSDHGEMLHDQGLLGKWERHYDPCIRVPLIISAPGVSPGEREHLVEHTDITATIYDWAGVEAPTLPSFSRDQPGSIPMLHGQSLVPLLAATDLASWRSAVLVQSNNSHADASPASWARTIRTSRHRYTRHLDGGGEQLFDLEADPDEQLNLAYHPDHQALRNQLLYELMDLSVRDAYPNSPRGLYSIGAW